MSREFTTEEVREQFLEAVRARIIDWSNNNRRNEKEKLEGLAFSILSLIDGESIDLPGFILAPAPNSEDKQYYIKRNKNWYPENHEIEDKIKCDITGCLHDRLFNK